jgi:hypothetical protein
VPRRDPALQYHLSVEAELVPGLPFSRQTRTTSSAGARGESAGEGIYTTHIPAYWDSQLAFEEVGEPPTTLYLVKVRDPSEADILSPHQDLSPPGDVVVLARILKLDADKPLDIGRAELIVERWIAANPHLLNPEFDAGPPPHAPH